MKSLLLLLVLPNLISADISIDIFASEDNSQRQVQISGSETNIISDKEIETFQLYDGKLKEAINTYIGAKPSAVFLKSPTPWNDLYKTFSWLQVNRVLKPVKAKMLSVQYKPVLVLTQIFNNTSTKPATFKAVIKQNVEDTISSTWMTYEELFTGLNISYGFDIQAMAVSGKATMTYVSKWGENVMKSQTVTVGSETGLEIVLQPNQRAKAELFATRGGMEVQIDYEASLIGTVAVDYENGYKGHHFWGLDVNHVLNAGGINKTLYSSEVIKMAYYSDSEVVVRDIDTNDVYYNVGT